MVTIALEPFLTAQELAKELKVTVDTIWRYTRIGRIPSLRLGVREYRYRLSEVVSALAAQSTQPLQATGLRPSDPDKLAAFAGKVVRGDEQCTE